MAAQPFFWETHGIHMGTGTDRIKHGVDEIEEITELAIKRGYPAITFIIHTPRLTSFRYKAEKDTHIKFIRGDHAYFEYPEKIEFLRKKYSEKICIKYGIELEWQGSGLGLQWNRSKIFQAKELDFVIGSVHFSREGIPYDGSLEETEKLIKQRGGIENFWAMYIEELIEMTDSSWEMIQVVGHLDLPKLYAPLPAPLKDLENSSHLLARRMRTLLEMISDYNLALDINLSGINKGCGIYPEEFIVRRAKQLNIPVAVGTDTHHLKDLGKNYEEGRDFLNSCGYRQYVSFSKLIPQKRSLNNLKSEEEKYKTLNLGIELLNSRLQSSEKKGIPKFSFGGRYRTLTDNYKGSVSIGDYEAVRVRRGNKSVTISNNPPKINYSRRGLFSEHKDKPGVLSFIFNTLASEEINVETAFLKSDEKERASAFLTLSGTEERIARAVEFIKGTSNDNYFNIKMCNSITIQEQNNDSAFLLEVDGVDLPIRISEHMIISVHNNKSGVLLILLSALASRGINISSMQLGRRNAKAYAALGLKDADPLVVRELIRELGPQFHEVSYISPTSLFE